jgi:protein ImuA
MSKRLGMPRLVVRARVEELRANPVLFSFRPEQAAASDRQTGVSPKLGVRPGGIVEWLTASEGAGAMTLASQIVSECQSSSGGVWAIVDSSRECFSPALSGWGIDPSRILVLRPATLDEACWTVEQSLRCPGIAATWAWVDPRIPARVLRRWQLAAEVGGGVGMLFRPVESRRQPVWADMRLMITPRAGGQEETRRVQVDVLYRRGGLGGGAGVWEIDHATGVVHLVPEVAHSATAERAARA